MADVGTEKPERETRKAKSIRGMLAKLFSEHGGFSGEAPGVEVAQRGSRGRIVKETISTPAAARLRKMRHIRGSGVRREAVLEALGRAKVRVVVEDPSAAAEIEPGTVCVVTSLDKEDENERAHVVFQCLGPESFAGEAAKGIKFKSQANARKLIAAMQLREGKEHIQNIKHMVEVFGTQGRLLDAMMNNEDIRQAIEESVKQDPNLRRSIAECRTMEDDYQACPVFKR